MDGRTGGAGGVGRMDELVDPRWTECEEMRGAKSVGRCLERCRRSELDFFFVPVTVIYHDIARLPVLPPSLALALALQLHLVFAPTRTIQTSSYLYRARSIVKRKDRSYAYIVIAGRLMNRFATIYMQYVYHQMQTAQTLKLIILCLLDNR